jgi:hypothetical protein
VSTFNAAADLSVFGAHQLTHWAADCKKSLFIFELSTIPGLLEQTSETAFASGNRAQSPAQDATVLPQHNVPAEYPQPLRW